MECLIWSHSVELNELHLPSDMRRKVVFGWVWQRQSFAELGSNCRNWWCRGNQESVGQYQWFARPLPKIPQSPFALPCRKCAIRCWKYWNRWNRLKHCSTIPIWHLIFGAKKRQKITFRQKKSQRSQLFLFK